MSDETHAVDGATPAAPVSEEPKQETTAPPATAEGESAEPAKSEQPRDEKGKFVQERINELTKARRQAERERDAYAEQLQHYRSQQQQAAPPSDTPPAFEDFPDLNQWAAAVAQHAARQAEVQAERKFSERQHQTSQAQVFEQYADREREYAAKDPEYTDAYAALQSSVRFHPTTLEVIASSDIGPAVVKHLGTHLDVADRVSRMAPHLAAAEIARIEAQIKAPKPKPVTSAPNPPPSLGAGKAIANKDPERMTDAEFAAWRRAQIAQRGAG